MSSFFDLVTRLENNINTLTEIMMGDENSSVIINGAQKASITKQITDLLSVLNTGQRDGVLAFRTLAELDVFSPSAEQQNASFKVSQDSDNSKNGYYTYNGTSYDKDSPLVESVLNPDNSTNPISGKAVADYLEVPNHFALKKTAPIPGNIKVSDKVFYQCESGLNSFNGIIDENDDAIEITLQQAALVCFTKGAKGFTYQKVREFSQAATKNLSTELGADAVVCRDASFRVDDTTPFQTGTNPISIEIDFTLDHTNGGTASIIGYGSLLAANCISVGILSDYSRLFIGLGTVGDNLFYVFNLEQGKRYHVIYTLDSDFARLYVNGELTQEKPATPYSLVTGQKFNIGGYYNYTDPQYLFRSPINLVRYFNAALTAADVATIYNEGRTLEHFDSENNILELSAKNCNGNVWLDTSDKENHPYLLIPSTNPSLTKVDVVRKESESTNSASLAVETITKPNLFDIDNVLHDHIIDSGSGLVAPWVDQSSIAGVVKLYVTENPAWYKVHGIDQNFGGFAVQVAGYTAGDARLGLLPWSDANHNTFRSYRDNGQVGIVYLQIYRLPSSSSEVPNFSNIYIEKLDDELDYQGSEPTKTGADQQVSLGENSFYNLANSKELVTVSSLFKDKRLLVLGDSITASNQWLGLMTKKLGMTKVINAAIGGGNIYGNESQDSQQDTNRQLTPQLRFTPFKHDKKIRSYGELEDSTYVFKPDNIIIAMGFNDANNGWQIGDWETVKNLDWRTMPLDSVVAYLRYNIEKLHNDIIDYQIPINSGEIEVKNVALDCRQSKIIYQTPIHTGGDDALATRLQAIRDAITLVCNDYSIPIINAKDNSGISRLVELNTNGKYLLDTIHPNADGYKKLAECNTSAFVSLAL